MNTLGTHNRNTKIIRTSLSRSHAGLTILINTYMQINLIYREHNKHNRLSKQIYVAGIYEGRFAIFLFIFGMIGMTHCQNVDYIKV